MKKQKNPQLQTLITPIYNQSPTLPRFFSRLHRLLTSRVPLEVLLIDDGSTDGSGELCMRFAKKHPEVRYFRQENQGVSAARNVGLRHASGKYIFFLDADDCLADGTIEEVVKFFDSVQEETDLVTYRIETIYNGRVLPPHFRYRYLKESGVYDLREWPYIGQTTMNIAVRNRFEKNILFDESRNFSEDQKYCCDILGNGLKMGFCGKGKYIYYRSPGSSSGRLAGACYIFEQCMEFFEELFGRYQEVPAAFQGLYVNDLYWKMADNILFPYHYAPEEFDRAVGRIRALLARCDNQVILEHPQIDFFEKFYLLWLKSPDSLQCFVSRELFGLRDKSRAALCERSVELVITRVRAMEGRVTICGFIKSAFFRFYDGEPALCAVENGGERARRLSLRESSHCYYRSRHKTQRFFAFQYQAETADIRRVGFRVGFAGNWYPVRYYFMPLTPFSADRSVRYTGRGIRVRLADDGFLFENIRQKRERRIWLYYDCAGVARDNGYLQFVHDVALEDGVERYYIVSDPRQAEDRGFRKHYVKFGSRRHRRLLTQCEKVITAYIEENNILPYRPQEYGRIAPKLRFETIYLQHGVLHIRMPWKYSPERIMADRIVVSAKQEANLYVESGFARESLIPCRMPRFDSLDRNRKKEKRILFAPSWRSYLIGPNTSGHWQPLPEKFLASTYYRKIQEFLKMPELDCLLNQSGYVLELKLHPIFEPYRKYFFCNGTSVRIAQQIREEDYGLMITDFSSFLYDFLYLKTPVISFIPDIMEFLAGMNGYRELNEGKDYREKVTTTPEQLYRSIERYLQKGEYTGPEADFFEGGEAAGRIWTELLKRR